MTHLEINNNKQIKRGRKITHNAKSRQLIKQKHRFRVTEGKGLEILEILENGRF